MELWETVWNALMESGVDRGLVGGTCRFVLPRAQRCAAAVWQRSRPSLAADYAAARSAPVWRKALAGALLTYLVSATVAFGHTTGWAFDDGGPLWSTAWFISLTVIAWLYMGWMGVRWAMRRSAALLR